MDDLCGRLDMGLRSAVTRRRDRFERIRDALRHADPTVRVDLFRRNVEMLMLRAESLLTQRLELLRQGFGDNAARLEVLSPLKTLARGYVLASRCSSGTAVTDAASLEIGERLLVTFHQGQAHCVVESLDSGKT
jgi:exodeoxyribonuclease VII large subunit